MSRAEALNSILHEIDRRIDDVCEQRLILSLTHPLAVQHRELVDYRSRVRQELSRIASNVVQFSRRELTA